MAKIKTRDLLYEYINRQLGGDYLEVEISEDSLDDVVRDTIKEFSEFAYDGELEETVIVQVDGSGNYTLPEEIQTIEKVSQGGMGSIGNFGGNYGAGFVPNIWSENFFTGSITGITDAMIGVSTTRAQLDKFFGDDLAYDFNSHKKKLRLFEEFSGPLLIHYTAEYTPDAVDFIYDATWVKRMCVEQARLLVSTVTGKYESQLVGGGTINHDIMRSMAQEAIQTLKEELQNQYAGAAPIDIS